MILSINSWWEGIKSNVGMSLLIAFTIAQLVNVILSTVKSILTVKGSRLQAVVINTISYTINAGVISQVAKISDTVTVCIVTAFTNMIGVSFSLWLLDKLRKEKTWMISCTIKAEMFDIAIDELKQNNISFRTPSSDWPERKFIDIISHTKEESKIASSIIKKYNMKYVINVNNASL